MIIDNNAGLFGYSAHQSWDGAVIMWIHNPCRYFVHESQLEVHLKNQWCLQEVYKLFCADELDWRNPQ